MVKIDKYYVANKKTSHTHLPNFFIVGAAKGGTTSLHQYLSKHPEVYMSPIKETNFFSQADIKKEFFNKEYKLDINFDLEKYLSKQERENIHIANIEKWDDYIRLFKNVSNEKAIGESSNSYLFCPSAAKAIKEKIPNPKIIIILRNPIDRAFSHYLMNRRLGKTLNEDFIRELEYDYYKKTKGWGVSRLYLELGLYHQQVKRFIDTFSNKQIKIIIYDDYKTNSRETLNQLCYFLKITTNIIDINLSKEHNKASLPRFKYINYILTQMGIINFLKKNLSHNIKNNLQKALYSNKKLPKLNQYEKEFLTDFYKKDIEKLSNLLNKDLSFWLK
ncbi:sulfotransferase [Nitrosococcus halophilus Nc 4]|uniref:Sulfotransferase n=1 Tax=Nitrosococcus halophilus (strain Nc4) TaxID=472759 RepID=D5C0N8_NITHN|nr:sulfotransferase [Nitrosococcus halophilus]ADE16361.1 sulfotransferase [Nitrosococcus halophilus Nc 4]